MHYNYDNLAQFRAKQRRYVAYDARMLREQGIQPRPHKFITQPLRQFVWRSSRFRVDGWHGLRLSLLMACMSSEVRTCGARIGLSPHPPRDHPASTSSPPDTTRPPSSTGTSGTRGAVNVRTHSSRIARPEQVGGGAVRRR